MFFVHVKFENLSYKKHGLLLGAASGMTSANTANPGSIALGPSPSYMGVSCISLLT